MSKKSQKSKRIAKAGRPKVEGVAREPNGRISRSGISHPDAHKTALVEKAKHLGLTVEQVKDQKVATFIGYLNILGKAEGISDDQYEALTKYIDLRRNYLLAIKAPNADRQDHTPGAGSDEISDSYIEWCKVAIETHKNCRTAIQNAQNASRCNLWAALDLCVLQNQSMPHMIPDVRLLANAFIQFFRV